MNEYQLASLAACVFVQTLWFQKFYFFFYYLFFFFLLCISCVIAFSAYIKLGINYCSGHDYLGNRNGCLFVYYFRSHSHSIAPQETKYRIARISQAYLALQLCEHWMHERNDCCLLVQWQRSLHIFPRNKCEIEVWIGSIFHDPTQYKHRECTHLICLNWYQYSMTLSGVISVTNSYLYYIGVSRISAAVQAHITNIKTAEIATAK